jgi:osmotically inducible lipoprotein OsmB
LTFFLKEKTFGGNESRRSLAVPSRGKTMKTKTLSAMILVPLALSLAACGDTWEQRAVTGAGIGAGTGLAVGALAGWPLIGPALVGAALGGGIGAATTPGGIMSSK